MSEERRAILIGSSQFPNDPTLTPLRCPENDVDGLGRLLCSEAQGGHFREVVSLKNQPHYEVLKAVNLALKRAKKDDFVLVYYSGHGKLDRAGRLYLAASNTEVEALEATSIPVAAILDYIRLSNCRKAGLILDCCYSGAVGDSIFKGGVEEQLQQASSGGGIYILTASTGVQAAQEKEKDEYGLLTKHIIQGIESGEADPKEEGQISMDDLYEYVHREVMREGFQEPMKWDLGVKGELIVARSGKTPREERRKQIRLMMLKYAEQHLISDRLLSRALEVLNLKPDELQGDLRKCDDLLRRLLKEQLPLGEFIDQWYGLSPAVGKISPRTGAPEAGAVKTNPDDGQSYVWMPPGEFQMGCSPGDKQCSDDEKPARTIKITRGFWLGQTPVTVGAFRRFAENTGISMPGEPATGQRKLNPQWSDLEQPLVAVTWTVAKAYCESWARGRLPTEAEWEYAARAGSAGARYGELDAIAWYDGNSGERIHQVKQKQPNAWGLYDMLGNVWEWVSDWYEENYYKDLPSPVADPMGPPAGTYRVMRGGSWVSYPWHVRASVRFRYGPEFCFNYIGFRCARDVIP
ncbi:MAG: SUMF1/EgtB/PvdO family nonheme iron enzyme [Acidobacteria bacterium]|nr:SUMF1/EgtB/PvdO family nonheme iron enzyme [Acidobacteriota bacterium]